MLFLLVLLAMQIYKSSDGFFLMTLPRILELSCFSFSILSTILSCSLHRAVDDGFHVENAKVEKCYVFGMWYNPSKKMSTRRTKDWLHGGLHAMGVVSGPGQNEGERYKCVQSGQSELLVIWTIWTHGVWTWRVNEGRRGGPVSPAGSLSPFSCVVAEGFWWHLTWSSRQSRWKSENWHDMS